MTLKNKVRNDVNAVSTCSIERKSDELSQIKKDSKT